MVTLHILPLAFWLCAPRCHRLSAPNLPFTLYFRDTKRGDRGCQESARYGQRKAVGADWKAGEKRGLLAPRYGTMHVGLQQG